MNKDQTQPSPTALHFINGTESRNSYAVVAHRGSIFLGIGFPGLMSGEQLGVAGRTYLHVRVRSARDQQLADALKTSGSQANVVNLLEQQLSPEGAWPEITFDKVDAKRASVVLGMFIEGSVPENGDKVVARIDEADLFRKLVNHVIEIAGLEQCIAQPAAVAGWLSDQASPLLAQLHKAAAHHKSAMKAQDEFMILVTDQLETPGSHLQAFGNIHKKHHDALGSAAQ